MGLDLSTVSTGVVVLVGGVPLHAEAIVRERTREPRVLTLGRIRDRVLHVAQEYNVAHVVAEAFYVKKGRGLNIYPMMFLHGAVAIALAENGFGAPVYVPISTAKKLIGGHGRADKDEMREGVERVLGVRYEVDDIADAAALAILCERRVGYLRGEYQPSADEQKAFDKWGAIL